MRQDAALFRVTTWLWLFLALSPFFIVWKGIFFAIFFLLICLIWGLSYRLDIGWYILVFLAPMWHLTFRFVDYWYLFQEYPQILGIYAPFVDFWAIFLLLAFIVQRVRLFLETGKFHIRFPLIGVYLLFLASALLSLWYVPFEHMSATIKFIIRSISFFYVAFVVLGVNIIDSKEKFHRSLRVFASVGLLGAIMGLFSIFLGVWEGGIIPRVVPFALGRFAPFGDQHIFLGEAIVATLPIWLYFWYQERDLHLRDWYAGISLFMLLIGLLTFSRATWICFFVAGCIIAYAMKEQISLKKLWTSAWWLISMALILAALFMVFLFTTYNVGSSTEHRYYLFEIAMYLFSKHPLIGNGAGIYPLLSQEIYFFQWEIGGVQESHGWVQQLLSEQGLLGFGSFLLFFALLFLAFIRRYRNHQYSTHARTVILLCCLLVALPLTFQLFSTHLYTSKLWVPVSLAIAGYLVYKNDRHYYASKSPNFIQKSTLFNL